MSANPVFTGRGVVCASGVGTEALAACLRSGRSAVEIDGPPESWRLDGGAVDFRGRVSPLALRRLDVTMRRSLHAALEAIENAGLASGRTPERTGVVVGTGFAGSGSAYSFVRTAWESGPGGADPSLFPNTVPNGPAGQLSIALKARGPCTSFFEAGTAGESALAFARDAIHSGRADVMVVCGADERSRPMIEVEADLARTSRETENDGRLRPFDRDRSGTALGDAAAVLVLESEDHATARNATVLAHLGALAMGAEATPPGQWPTDAEAYARVIRRALARSSVTPTDLAFVNASACGSPHFDGFEAQALRIALGSDTGSLPVTAPKGHTGDLSSSGVLRTVVSLLALEQGIIPGTPRLRTADPTIGLDLVSETRSLTQPSRRVLQVGSGSGGTHAAFVISGA